jgi:hypothetical protein
LAQTGDVAGKTSLGSTDASPIDLSSSSTTVINGASAVVEVVANMPPPIPKTDLYLFYTPQAAAFWMLSRINGRSIRENRELGGAIRSYKGYYYADKPNIGDLEPIPVGTLA